MYRRERISYIVLEVGRLHHEFDEGQREPRGVEKIIAGQLLVTTTTLVLLAN